MSQSSNPTWVPRCRHKPAKYAQERASFRAGEIRILDSTGIERTIPIRRIGSIRPKNKARQILAGLVKAHATASSDVSAQQFNLSKK
jgi:hypothetical protein